MAGIQRLAMNLYVFKLFIYYKLIFSRTKPCELGLTRPISEATCKCMSTAHSIDAHSYTTRCYATKPDPPSQLDGRTN